ncbi:hypothetical protein GCM10028819_25460 [Spirosoma humi]
MVANGYVDQPYTIVLPSGKWFSCPTVSPGGEGSDLEAVRCLFSTDQGKTWSSPAYLEQHSNLSNSYALPYLTTFNRLYVFYMYNGDNIRQLNGKKVRNDMLGWFCYRYSDDEGKSWSERYRLPIRTTSIDLTNDWQGKVQMMWGTGKPVRTNSGMFFGFSKIGTYLIDNTEGWFMNSPNIDHEKDPQKLIWNMLPKGDEGIKNPQMGTINEEQNLVELSDGTLYCVYRTSKGYPAHALSKDQGQTWMLPTPITYKTGNQLRHPRACPRIWKCQNGKYLLWFHNTSLDIRNPGWVTGGIEKDGTIEWSQPEVCIYSNDLSQRFSYPDLVEINGNYWLTETQKKIARIHSIDPSLFDDLWNQGTRRDLIVKGLAYQPEDSQSASSFQCQLPSLSTGGFTLEFKVSATSWSPGQILFDSRQYDAKDHVKGVVVQTGSLSNLFIQVSDGDKTFTLTTNPNTFTQLNKLYQVAFVVDGMANLGTAVVNGQLCDTGNSFYGWNRFDDSFSDINGTGRLSISPKFSGTIRSVRIYNRYLRTSELLSNYLSGK